MSSMLSSEGVFLATAMAAVSGTVILLAFGLQKSSPTTQFSIDQIPHDSSQVQAPRSCIASDKKKREIKKKRVQFAEDVVDPKGNGKEFRKQHAALKEASSSSTSSTSSSSSSCSSSNSSSSSSPSEFKKTGEMPANRMALFQGKLRDRNVQRLGYFY